MVEPSDVAEHHPDAIVGYGYEPGVLGRAGIEHAAGFVAGTDNDTTNLSLIAAARRANPTLFVAARQNRVAIAPLFAAVEVDSMLVPADVVAHEVYAQLSTPLMWRFLQEVPRREDAWAAAVVGRLTQLCGEHLQAVWKVRLTATESPALQAWLAEGGARLGDLLRNPDDRDEPLHVVPLLLARAAGGDNGADVEVAPDDDVRRWPRTMSCCSSARRPRVVCLTPRSWSTPPASTSCTDGTCPRVGSGASSAAVPPEFPLVEIGPRSGTRLGGSATLSRIRREDEPVLSPLGW